MSAIALQAELREVRLYGVLAKKFGRVHRLAVLTAQEAVQALCAVLPGFRAHMQAHSEPGYQVFVGSRRGSGLPAEQLATPAGTREPISIVPVVAGAKKQGVGNIIAGVVLIVASLVYGFYTEDWKTAVQGVSYGSTLIFQGVLQYLSAPKPTERDKRANQTSFGFDGPVNTDEEGLPVPVNYGRVITGGARISAGISTDELPIAASTGGLTPAVLPGEQPQNPKDYDFRDDGGGG